MATKTIGYKETKEMLDKAFGIIETRGCDVQWNQAPSNSTALALADEQGVEALLYIHSQAIDTLRESGYLYIGHSDVEVDWVLDVFNNTKGLTADCKDFDNEKILVYPEVLDDESEWKVEEGEEPEHELWNEILEDNPEMSPQDIVDGMQSNSDVELAKASTIH